MSSESQKYKKKFKLKSSKNINERKHKSLKHIPMKPCLCIKSSINQILKHVRTYDENLQSSIINDFHSCGFFISYF